MAVGRTCPKCQSFDVREMIVQVQGTDRHAYVCHDCLCVFHIFDLGADDPPPVSKVTRLPKKPKRPKQR
jgi:transposase-like protein